MAHLIRSIKKFSTRKIETSGSGFVAKDTEPLPPFDEGERETIIMTLSPTGPISPLKLSEKDKRKEKKNKRNKRKN